MSKKLDKTKNKLDRIRKKILDVVEIILYLTLLREVFSKKKKTKSHLPDDHRWPELKKSEILSEF